MKKQFEGMKNGLVRKINRGSEKWFASMEKG
jgi:hypothetical protein